MNQLLHFPAVKILLAFLQTTPTVPILLLLMFIDVFTGMIAGFITSKLNSSVSWKGMSKKAVVVLLVGMAVAIDPLTPDLPEASIVAMFYIANEMLSILENAVICGVPLPPILVNAMIKVRDFSTSEKRLENHGKSVEQKEPPPGQEPPP